MPEENPFIQSLPQELRSEPSLASFKDIGSLAKSHVEAQKLIGAARVAIPGEKATDAEWDAFYNKIGRPETIDKYETVELKDEKGNVLYKPDDNERAELMKHFHKIGLTARQAKAMQEYSLKYFHQHQSKTAAEKEQASAAAINGLKQEWGDKFDVNVDTAKSVIKKFGGDKADEILGYLNESGLGNNVPLIKLFAAIGGSVMEDTTRRGIDHGLPINDVSRAKNEIDTLMADDEFQKALGTANHPGHQAAVDRWFNLHKVAHPGQVAS